MSRERIMLTQAIPAVQQLRRVQGFDPLRFLKRNANGGIELEPRYQRLWFRLACPDGKMLLNRLQITDQIAVYEAQVFLSREDNQPITNFTAAVEKAQAPAGRYVQAAQDEALKTALDNAGFGIQLCEINPSAAVDAQADGKQEVATGAVNRQETAPAVNGAAAPQREDPIGESHPVQAVPTPQEVQPQEAAKTPNVNQQEVHTTQQTESVSDAMSLLQALSGGTAASEPDPVMPQKAQEVPSETAEPAVTERAETARTVKSVVVDMPAAASTVPAPRYSDDMTVDEILSLMTEEEAAELVVTTGVNKGWTMAQVSEQRPSSLKYYAYDNEGNTVASTDGNGNTTRYTYDGLNRAISSTNAEGNTAYNTYDADGRMVKSVNEEGAETAYAYDADGRLISMTDALGNVTSFEYDSRDRVIKVTDAKGNATTFTYDLAGNVKSETNAKGVVTSYAYDANGNLTSMTDAAGTVTYTYDALNRVTSVKDRRGNTQFFTYDATDRIVQVKDRNGNATQYVYDGNGNIVKTIDALGTESVFTYNKNDQLISTDLHRVDALNGVDSHEITLYEYDGRNLVTKEINALGDSTVYVYDGNGNLVSKTDADGYVTRYSYTVLDLVKKINYNGAKEVSYQYNKVGELVQMDDWTGTNTFELDLLGRLQKMTDHKGNTVSYTYDAVGNQTGITYPDGSKTRSFYDAVYNLTSVIDADDGTYAYVYDAANRPVKLTYPNGWIEQYTYDAEGNLLKTVDTDPFQLYNKTPKVKYEYTYDAEGNVLTEFQRDSDATENLKSRTAFTYDALNRLTGSTRRLEVYPYDTLAYAYTYDTLGNLLKQSGPTKGEEDTYQYNDLNQMVSKHVCGYEQKITRIYDYGYTYDKRGNLVKEEEICSPTTTGPENITIATYLYDETNRMVRGTNKAGEVSAYTFNGLGVRVGTELILKDNTHGYTDFHCQTPSVETGIEKPEVVKTDYVIDYTRLDIDQRVLMKSEQDGYDFFYTYGLDKLQVMTIGEGSNWWGQSVKKCVNMAYVHTDRLGSVVNLSDQYGRVTARADYTDWGEVRRYTDITVDGGFRRLLPEITYATHEYDDVLNQFYAKARMYDAENKRFDAVDPVKGLVTQPVSLVQYVYVFDNPVSYIDPDGEFGLLAGTIIATAASAVISGATAAYQSYKTEGKVNWKQVGKAAVGGAAAAVSVGIAVATGGTALGVGVMAAGAIAGTRTALHGGNAADIASSMGKASAGAAVGGKALSAASATVKFVAGVAGTAAGTAATVKTTQTAAKTIRDKNATTQEKAAAVFDAALSAAGTIGSAALAVKSFPAVKQEIGYYMAKYQCKAKNMSQSVDTTSSPSVQEQSELLTWNEFQHKNKGLYTKAEMSEAWKAYKAENGIVTPSPVSHGVSHGNSLADPRTNYGYRLVEIGSGKVLKYGESLDPTHRYTSAYLKEHNAKMEILTSGSKETIHKWQITMNNQYKCQFGQYPDLVFSSSGT